MPTGTTLFSGPPTANMQAYLSKQEHKTDELFFIRN